MSNVTRRDWIRWFGGIAPAATLIGCSTTKLKTPDAAVDAAAGAPATNIMDNHSHAPHVMTVTAEDVAAGVDKQYHIMGAANHDHVVTITAAQFAMLAQQGAAVADLSTPGSIDNHTHCCVTYISGSGTGSGSSC